MIKNNINHGGRITIRYLVKYVIWKTGISGKPIKKIAHEDYSDEWFAEEMKHGYPNNTICEDIRTQYKLLKVIYVKAKKMGRRLREYERMKAKWEKK